MTKKTNEKDLALQNMFAEDASAGLESISKEDIKFPMLVPLQALSPQVTKGEEDYVEGAKAGDIFHTGNKTLHNELYVIPFYFVKTYMEWKKRSCGGGLVNVFNEEDGRQFEARQKANPSLLNPEHEFLQHNNLFCLLVNKETKETEPVLISLKSTGLSVSRHWTTLMAGAKNRPIWGVVYKLSIAYQKNEKGSWYGFKVDVANNIEDFFSEKDTILSVYEEAKSLHKTALSSDLVAKVDFEQNEPKLIGSSSTSEAY